MNQNLWDTMKVVLIGNILALSAFTRKLETFHKNKLMMLMKALESQEKNKGKEWTGRD